MKIAEGIAARVGATLGAYLAVRLLRWAVREYTVQEALRELDKGVPRWAR
jgi:hypothetical protein